MYAADNICKMIEFLIDNIFVQFGGCLFRQAIGIPIRTNCAPLLADLFLYSDENEFLDNMIRSGHSRLAKRLIHAKDTLMIWSFLITRSFWSILKRYIHSNWLSRKLTSQITWQTTLISHPSWTVVVSFQPGYMRNVMIFISTLSIFHSVPAAYHLALLISQLMRYAWWCSHYDNIRYRHKCLVDRLLSQGFLALTLERSFKKFYGRYEDLIQKYQYDLYSM